MPEAETDVQAFISRVTPAKRQRDAHTMLELMKRATGEQPRLSGTIIGFGTYHYKYESGREGVTAAAGFAPRKPATTIYLVDGISAHTARLKKLGPHTTGVGCLYIKDLEEINLAVLEAIIAESYRTLTRGTYTLRSRRQTVASH